MNRAGWITIIILCSFISLLVGALIWSFVKPLPNNFDLLTFIEVSLGLMIGILAIIVASFVAFQWSSFETRLRETIDEARAIAATRGKEQAYDVFNTLVKPEVSEKINKLEQEVERINNILDRRYAS